MDHVRGIERDTVDEPLELAACAAAVSIPPNRYGLSVVPDYATYARIARLDPEKDGLELLPGSADS